MSQPKRRRMEEVGELAAAENEETENLSTLTEPLIRKITEFREELETPFIELMQTKLKFHSKDIMKKKFNLIKKLKKRYDAQFFKAWRRFSLTSQPFVILQKIYIEERSVCQKFIAHTTELNNACVQRDTVLSNLGEQIIELNKTLHSLKSARNLKEFKDIHIPDMESENGAKDSLSKMQLLAKEWKEMKFLSRYKYFCGQMRSLLIVYDDF